MGVYSDSYWLAIFCTSNSSPVLTRKQNAENPWRKERKIVCFLQTLYIYDMNSKHTTTIYGVIKTIVNNVA